MPPQLQNYFSSHIAPLSRLWLVQLRLNLCFLQPIAMAIGFSPARRSAAPVQRQIPGKWHNMRTGPLIRSVRAIHNRRKLGWIGQFPLPRR